MPNKLSLLAAVVFFVSGCAHVEVVRVTPDNPDQDGVRFYRPAPYLWVTKDTGDRLQGTIVWLPNKNEEYAIRVNSGIGSVDVKYKLADGWNLTEMGDVRDSNIPETITALTGLLEGMKTGMATTEIHVGLYVLHFDEKTGLVKKLEPVEF